MVQLNKMKLVHKPVFSLRHDRRMSKLSIFLVFGMGFVHNQLFRCPTLYSFDVHTDMGRGLIHILPHIKTRVIEGIFLSALDFIEGGVAERQGFEPWKVSPPCRFSRPVHSTALPSLRRTWE